MRVLNWVGDKIGLLIAGVVLLIIPLATAGIVALAIGSALLTRALYRNFRDTVVAGAEKRMSKGKFSVGYVQLGLAIALTAGHMYALWVYAEKGYVLEVALLCVSLPLSIYLTLAMERLAKWASTSILAGSAFWLLGGADKLEEIVFLTYSGLLGLVIYCLSAACMYFYKEFRKAFKKA